MPEYSAVELAQHKLEWRKCSKDFAYWIDTYGKMWLKEGGDPIDFKLWEFQKDCAYKFQHEQQLIILKARQMGISWTVSGYTLWKVMFWTNFHAYYTSIGIIEVLEQVERIRFIFAGLPEWMKEKARLGGKDCKNNDSLIEFTNGSAIHATSSSKSAGHGAAPGLVICDEWSRVEGAMEKWRAILPSIGKKTQVFIVSTSDGLNNHFADVWFDAVAGNNKFIPVFYSCWEHPLYTEEYLEEKKADFAGDLQGYLQAYPRTPEDAFLSASRSFFPHERIAEAKALIAKHKFEPQIGYIDDEEREGVVYRKFVPDDIAHFYIWQHPKAGHAYTIGADVATGVIGGDWSVAVVFDTETREIVAMYRDKLYPEDYATPLRELALYYNNAWLVVEVNTASEIIMQELKATYPWLYMRQMRTHFSDAPTLVPGYWTGPHNKPSLLANMRRQFSLNEKPLMIYSSVILDEMSTFEQRDNKKLEAAKGKHDDCVMAVALALEGETTIPYTGDWEFLRGEIEQGRQNWRSL